MDDAEQPERTATFDERTHRALTVAYRFIAKRDRTEQEVRVRLARDEESPAVADAAVAELLELDYLNDGRYAQRFVEDRRALDGWGDGRIEQRLRRLGVADELVARALRSGDGESQLDAAIALLRRRWPQPPADARDRARALGVLARKGYASDVAYAAVRALERDAPLP